MRRNLSYFTPLLVAAAAMAFAPIAAADDSSTPGCDPNAIMCAAQNVPVAPPLVLPKDLQDMQEDIGSQPPNVPPGQPGGGGGLMGLVANGAQDVYLPGQPIQPPASSFS